MKILLTALMAVSLNIQANEFTIEQKFIHCYQFAALAGMKNKQAAFGGALFAAKIKMSASQYDLGFAYGLVSSTLPEQRKNLAANYYDHVCTNLEPLIGSFTVNQSA